ncbi:7TM diverse intracellular signaling domain-containing protein [Crocinitomix catalasitica]|uniref:7TM diverse intracellular signaling domain-containing protein n=1 Tax=Crocinitomix catalasitica TaxID=184607 RepID=UPI0004801996|nr:7TM diverse intracellular signaling domain-containing protein [Crocinitomix catalasitica]
MKAIFLSIIFFSITISFTQTSPVIHLDNENLSNSFANKTSILVLDEDDLSASQVLKIPDNQFVSVDQEIINFDFTNKTYWVKFSVINNSDFKEFYIETARAITNKVNLYEVVNGVVVDSSFSGDDYPYAIKKIGHRKNLFQLNLDKGDTSTFLLKMVSDGEMLFFPLYINNKAAFHTQDFKVQFTNGFYYGLISLVFIIYFFFYIFLKDKSFLFYIFYVLSQGLLQFSLDGYSHHHFFSQGGYLTNHSLLLFAGITIVFLLLYVNSFLDLKKRFPTLRRVFIGVGVFVILGMVLALFVGPLYVIAYPIINLSSLFAIIVTVFSVLYIRAKGGNVDIFFTIAFIVLITGAVIFILGNFNLVENKTFTLGALKISSALEFVILSISMSNKYGQLQREKNQAQAIALKRLEEKNTLMDEINVKLEQQVLERTKKIEEQNVKLAVINDEIVSSIKYAKRIQEAILPANDYVKALIPDSFVYYLPKDVVSGDFYFVEKIFTSNSTVNGYTLIAAVDCTGHGVPGAFLSIVGNNLLTESLTEINVNTPAEALDFLNVGLSKTLRQQQQQDDAVRDGMDISLCAISEDRSHLMFAGAKNPMYIVRRKDANGNFVLPEHAELRIETKDLILCEIKGDSHPIGNYFDNTLRPFTNHKVDLIEGDIIYLFSDGYADQFGGPREKKFTYGRFRELLIKISQLPANEQEENIHETLVNWQGDTWQLDDILVIGVKV